ncbi:MAG TPA: alpha/beta fold hydrolase [Thermoanaerobaculia bacterium]|nr:alpha/beta fold hydrolase [Thermoanaerobaculia bacterium]
MTRFAPPARVGWGTRLSGHLWTLAPLVRRADPSPPSVRWQTSVEDPQAGPVRLTGRWSEVPGAEEAVVLVHGIAGSHDAVYMRRGAAAAVAAGISCLRINLRGADRSGEDYYHAGLTADLAAAVASPELAPSRRLFLLGYSLGGHVALRLATEAPDERIAAVAAICSPVDLALGQRMIDSRRATPYRRHVLRGLRQIYAPVAARRADLVPVSVETARRIRTMREWDHRVVAPRHGFASAEDYYRQVSVARRLDDLAVPALLVRSDADPMIPAAGLVAALAGVEAPRLTVQWVTGGHLGFPRKLVVGSEAVPGLDPWVLAWLRRAGGEGPRPLSAAPPPAR